MSKEGQRDRGTKGQREKEGVGNWQLALNHCLLPATCLFPSSLLCAFVPLCLCAFLCTAYAETTHTLTLQEAVKIGLSNSRELAMANLQLEMTKVSLKETLAQVYPQVTGDIDSSYNNLEKIRVSDAILQGYNNNLSISLNQILWTGGKVINAIRCANEEIRISSLRIEQVKNEVIYKIVTSYWNLKKAVELKKACSMRVEYARSIMEIASAKYKEGLIPEVEMMKQEVNLSCAKEELIKALCQEKVAKDNLKNLLKIEGEIEILDEPVFVPLKVNEKEIILEVMTNNPEITGRESEAKSKELQIKIERADSLPTVNLIGSYNWSGEDRRGFKKSLDDVSEDSWKIGIGIEIPIFNGFYTDSKVKEAELNYKTAVENYNSLKDKIILETKEILAGLLAAEERVRVSEKNKDLGTEILRVTKVRYELGVATISDVKEAEETFIRSATMQIEAVIDYELGRMNMERIIGHIGQIGPILPKGD